ncbi:MAG TPA: Gfo/Idh/MocA family oxidoreductase, partial [Caballeronia sp.]|nr:Gfo/Idh/MocA family oxidoreductase [Caballeronia sp.]
MTIDVAVFGAGRIGKIHAANLAKQPGVRLKYVVDVNKEAAGALAALHGAQVADVEGALGDASIGATVVCSSTDT